MLYGSARAQEQGAPQVGGQHSGCDRAHGGQPGAETTRTPGASPAGWRLTLSHATLLVYAARI